MPFDVSVLPIFLAVSFVLLITPGPDVVFIVATGLSEGRRSALWASVGISLAMFVHSVLLPQALLLSCRRRLSLLMSFGLVVPPIWPTWPSSAFVRL